MPVAEILRHPESFAGRTIRISGRGERTPSGAPALRDDQAVILLEAIGFSLPDRFGQERLSAEGRVRLPDGERRLSFAAEGLEVFR